MKFLTISLQLLSDIDKFIKKVDGHSETLETEPLNFKS